MESAERRDVTDLLQAARREEDGAADRLAEAVYDRLRALAQQQVGRARDPATIEPTALCNEAFMRMVGSSRSWHDRAQFLAIAATAMRGILADRARARRRQKRGGAWARITLDGLDDRESPPALDVIALDSALDELAELSPRQARVVELRFFAGMTVDEAAEALGVSKTTVEQDWRGARAWLRSRLADSDA